MSDEERLLEFLYAAPVGLVEIDAAGTIAMINPHAMKHLLPLAGMRDASNLFAMLEECAPELRNLFDDFQPERGTVCDGHRIVVDLRPRADGADPKVLGCTLVKLDTDRAIACISDLTVQVTNERRLKQADTWFAALLNDVNDYAVLSITSEGLVNAANTSWTKQTGYSCDSVIGQSLDALFALPGEAGHSGTDEHLRLAARDGWHLNEACHIRKDGTRYWCQCLLAARTDSDGALTGYTVVLRDVERQIQDTDDLRRLLTQDHLTRAANRAQFQKLMDREHRHWRDRGTPLSLIMLDIDHFKLVNDSYGHPIGDLVLVHFADTIAGALRPSDLLARVGGEEFAVMLPATSLDDAVDIAERLRGLVAAMRVATSKGALAITVSLGCATATGDRDLMNDADEALYIAKRNGRNQVHAASMASAAAA